MKSEFRRTRSTDNPLHIIGFLSEWKKYLDLLPADAHSAGSWKGTKLDSSLLEKVEVLSRGDIHADSLHALDVE